MKPPIIHGDIRSANCFLTSLNSNEVCAKLGDFGMAVQLATKVKSTRVDFQFAPPEVFNGGIASTLSDIYGWSMVVAEMHLPEGEFLYGEFKTEKSEFWREEEKIEIKNRIEKHSLRPSLGGMSPRLQVLVQNCWKKKAEERPQAEEIVLTLCRMSGIETLGEVEGGNLFSEKLLHKVSQVSPQPNLFCFGEDSVVVQMESEITFLQKFDANKFQFESNKKFCCSNATQFLRREGKGGFELIGLKNEIFEKEKSESSGFEELDLEEIIGKMKDKANLEVSKKDFKMASSSHFKNEIALLFKEFLVVGNPFHAEFDKVEIEMNANEIPIACILQGERGLILVCTSERILVIQKSHTMFWDFSRSFVFTEVELLKDCGSLVKVKSELNCEPAFIFEKKVIILNRNLLEGIQVKYSVEEEGVEDVVLKKERFQDLLWISKGNVVKLFSITHNKIVQRFSTSSQVACISIFKELVISLQRDGSLIAFDVETVI